MARGSSGWLHPTKTHRDWHNGRISHRVSRPGSGRCAPLKHQQTNSSSIDPEHHLGDACGTLLPTRVAGHLQQNETGTGCGRRLSQVIRYPGDLRRVFEEMDRSALGLLPLDGGQGRRHGDLAQGTLLRKDRHPACTRKQGQDPQHHERSLFPCDSLGMGRPKSNHQRSPERQTPKGPGRPNAGRDCGNPQGIVRPSPDHGRAECLHWLAPRRAHWTSLGRRGIRGTYPSWIEDLSWQW